MDPTNKSSVIIHIRCTSACDYCELKLNRHNLKAHTQNAPPITITYMLLKITSWL